MSDIRGIIFSTKVFLPKQFCFSISPTANRKRSSSTQNMAVLINNALNTATYKMELCNFFRFWANFKYLQCKFIVLLKIAIVAYQYWQHCPKALSLNINIGNPVPKQ